LHVPDQNNKIANRTNLSIAINLIAAAKLSSTSRILRNALLRLKEEASTCARVQFNRLLFHAAIKQWCYHEQVAIMKDGSWRHSSWRKWRFLRVPAYDVTPLLNFLRFFAPSRGNLAKRHRISCAIALAIICVVKVARHALIGYRPVIVPIPRYSARNSLVYRRFPYFSVWWTHRFCEKNHLSIEPPRAHSWETLTAIWIIIFDQWYGWIIPMHFLANASRGWFFTWCLSLILYNT